MKIISLLTSLVAANTVTIYAVLLLAVTFEGEITLLFLGMLAHAHIIKLFDAVLIGIAGAILKTFWSYYLGVALARYIPKNKVFDFIENKVLAMFPHFKEKPFLSIFISKFIYGLNHATAIFSGYTKISFKTYAVAEMVSSIIWLILMFTLGYFFSFAAFSVTRNIQKVGILLIFVIIGFFIVSKCIAKIVEWVERE